VLLAQVDGQIAKVTADDAYDLPPVYQVIASQQPDPPSEVIIPPRASAVVSTADAVGQTQRDRHIRLLPRRIAWPSRKRPSMAGARLRRQPSGATRGSSSRSCAPAAYPLNRVKLP